MWSLSESLSRLSGYQPSALAGWMYILSDVPTPALASRSRSRTRSRPQVQAQYNLNSPSASPAMEENMNGEGGFFWGKTLRKNVDAIASRMNENQKRLGGDGYIGMMHSQSGDNKECHHQHPNGPHGGRNQGDCNTPLPLPASPLQVSRAALDRDLSFSPRI